MKEDRIIEQLDKMVAAGRLTPEEARRLRAAQGTPEFESAIAEMRARHASVRLDSAVAAGQMSRDEADNQLRKLQAGEHPKGLRAKLRVRRES